MRRFFLILLFFSAFVGKGNASPALKSQLEEFAALRSDPTGRKQLQEIVEVALQRAQDEPADLPTTLLPIFQKKFPLFITLQVDGKTRGCIGTLHPQRSNMAEEIIATVKRAMLQDPWHIPITSQEIPRLEVFLSAVGKPIPVRGIQEISPSRDGALLRKGRKEAIALPGEAKTQRYLLAFLKAKAGIKGKETFQLYRLPSVTLEISRNRVEAKSIGNQSTNELQGNSR